MASLKDLIKLRGQVKSQLTRFKSFVENIDPNNIPSQIKHRLAIAPDMLKEFNEIQSKIELLSDATLHERERDEFENQYFEVITRAEEYVSPLTNTVSSDKMSIMQPVQPNNQDKAIPLPVISLPRFSGRYDEALPFFELFSSLVDGKDNLSNTQKLYYLKTAVSGEAKDLINSLELIPTNYDVALKLLKDTYYNTNTIIKHHVKALFEIPKIEKGTPANLKNLLHEFTKNLRVLESMKQPVASWDILLVHFISTKFDNNSFNQWQITNTSDKLPSIYELTDFIKNRIHYLENTFYRPDSKQSKELNSKANPDKKSSFKTDSSSGQLSTHNKWKPSFNHLSSNSYHKKPCLLCNDLHHVAECQQFLQLNVNDRLSKVKHLGLCTNCLKPNHEIKYCKSPFNCKRCTKRHNTTLCGPTVQPSLSANSNKLSGNAKQHNSYDLNCNQDNTIQHTLSSINATSSNSIKQVILPTVIINVSDAHGNVVKCRALLDNGSQSSYLAESIVQSLNVKRHKVNIPIIGVNSSNTRVRSVVDATISNDSKDFVTNIQFFVLPKITEQLPINKIVLPDGAIPSHIKLADPLWSKPSKVQALIGSDLFWDIICNGRFTLDNKVHLIETKFGWIISGQFLPQTAHIQSSLCHLTTLDELSNQIEQFWTLEEGETSVKLCGDDNLCETIFEDSTYREPDGRYVVKLPLKQDPSILGESRSNALKRFLYLEKKFIQNPILHQEYSEFMQQYESLNHMKHLTDYEISLLPCHSYYIPHHAVIKESTTTKLRTVFDASSKTNTGYSLNDIALVGPTVQPSLISIILRFRTFNYVMTADLEKMYRQVLIHPSQRNLQLILWRKSPEDVIRTYQLQTVTYGVSSASYLATRTLLKLADDYQDQYPLAAQALRNSFYVDDFMAGGETIEETLELQDQIIRILKEGQFHIRKWSANDLRLLSTLERSDIAQEILDFNEESNIKTLGLMWNPHNDFFKFSISRIKQKTTLTKRNILSIISQIFDPLGLLSPVVTFAKIFMQQLWSQNLNWDEPIPDSLRTTWNIWYESLKHLENFKIPRSVLSMNPHKLELHGFSDASERAFGCCLYIRSLQYDQIQVHLLTAKSRVAPVKSTTIPRLELCGALLLAQILQTTLLSLQLNIDKIYLYTDSTIVLHWINSTSTNYNVFVANRIGKIQEITDTSYWRHIRGNLNPADLVSRGMNADSLESHSLWWHGPEQLSTNIDVSTFSSAFEDLLPLNHNLPEERKTLVHVSIKDNQKIQFNSFSSFLRMVRVVSYIKRFIFNCANLPSVRLTGPLSADELLKAEESVWKLIQDESFADELKCLKSGKIISKRSSILPLHPFIDSKGLLRVGGRLHHAHVNFNQRHPIIIPAKHHITALLLIREHKRLLHVGPQGLLNSIRNKYWPIHGRELCRKVCKQCITCFKQQPRSYEQLMGSLPYPRVQPARCFLHTGIDFCGPFYLKTLKEKRYQLHKAYVSLFICFTTKAIHLELVEDLSTAAFIAALRRFIGRRGVPGNIYCDNGTNFVGADKEIRKLVNSFDFKSKLINNLSSDGITFNFNPPAAPHFGALWESGVRIIKHHIKRVIGETHLTFFQFNTLLTQVESIVNSRPLTPLSNNSSDLNPLTPAHFLVGGPLTALPETDLRSFKPGRLAQWQLCQQMQQKFWERWSSEYLHNLQERSKWRQTRKNVQLGTLALIKDPNQPPNRWLLGRVELTHPGNDGLVRVVTLRTKSGNIKRPLTQICPLPIAAETQLTE